MNAHCIIATINDRCKYHKFIYSKKKVENIVRNLMHFDQDFFHMIANDCSVVIFLLLSFVVVSASSFDFFESINHDSWQKWNEHADIVRFKWIGLDHESKALLQSGIILFAFQSYRMHSK